jgi:hypothetical protein
MIARHKELAKTMPQSIPAVLPSLSFLRNGGFTAGRVLGRVGVFTLLLTQNAQTAPVTQSLEPARHPSAIQHVPVFITSPGTTDVLLVVMALVLIGAVLAAGVFFFWLHSLPERMVHNSSKVHFDIVAVLALLSLFTHIHLFWVAALLLALVKIPELSLPGLDRMAAALEKIAGGESKSDSIPLQTSKQPPQQGT